ncbi:MAG: DMT family transporter [Betaproteobacteria bacterium]|jgi:hypothetical protein|nr:DMT family transporter [Betaproteobacteria bacterium]NBT66662.1 DMT family transporter [Betaproteobacteria bacterium]NBY09269.1 DMT family transporter [Betaproteobacteria bacterium]
MTTSSTTSALTPFNAFLLVIPALLWAGNAVVGRLIYELVPPVTLNFLRWATAFVFLLPLAYPVLRLSSPLWPNWRRYAVLSLLGVGCYNTFQYMALHTSSPINVTLVASSSPVFMLAVGALFFKQTIQMRQIAGACLSIMGVIWVLSRGDWHNLLQVKWVIGDLYVILATIAWAVYSWMLSINKDPAELRSNWAYFLMAQVTMGLVWTSALTTAEWTLTDAHIVWGWPVALALIYVALGPAILAYRCWGLGVQRVGPNIAGFFSNLTPLFAAIFSSLALGDTPKIYHAIAFLLIVGGIYVSSRKPNQ